PTLTLFPYTTLFRSLPRESPDKCRDCRADHPARHRAARKAACAARASPAPSSEQFGIVTCGKTSDAEKTKLSCSWFEKIKRQSPEARPTRSWHTVKLTPGCPLIHPE